MRWIGVRRAWVRTSVSGVEFAACDTVRFGSAVLLADLRGERSIVGRPSGGQDGRVLAPPDHGDFEAWVAQLADPVRAQRAYRHLVVSGDCALPAIRVGLRSPVDDVRRLCTKAFDHLVDEDSFATLVAMLDDRDPKVRIEALHALACERCKKYACRPDVAVVLGRSITVLRSDSDRHVRERACEVVGRWVHTHHAAVEALVEAMANDTSAAVRKKASWYAPGGTIFLKTQQRNSGHA